MVAETPLILEKNHVKKDRKHSIQDPEAFHFKSIGKVENSWQILAIHDNSWHFLAIQFQELCPFPYFFVNTSQLC